MTNKDLRDVYAARPFKPFTIHLADGRKVSVQHPDFMLVPPKSRVFVVYELRGGLRILNVEMVTEIRVKANGAHKRR